MMLNSGRPVGLTDRVSLLFCLSGTRDDRQDEGRAQPKIQSEHRTHQPARKEQSTDQTRRTEAQKEKQDSGDAQNEGTELQQRKTPSSRMEQTLSLKILLTRTNTDEETAKDSRTFR